MNGPIIWMRTDTIADEEARHRSILDAVQAGFSEIMIRDGDTEMLHVASFIPIQLQGREIFIDGRRAGLLLTIRDEGDMPSSIPASCEFLVVQTVDWKIIPLENLIAMCQNTGTKLLAVTSSAEEARLFLQTLERGVDGIVVDMSSSPPPAEFSNLFQQAMPSFELEEAKVSGVRMVGMGDRVCIDTCSLLERGEGMLVGSQSGVLYLVHSESLESRFVNSRPFRVNAGPVHAYVMMAGGVTSYLSELQAGSHPLAVRDDGRCRQVVVGRIKIERRPLLLVETEVRGIHSTIILQNAETVNLCSPEGPRSVTSIKEGDRVKVHVSPGGRHFGMSVQETVYEW